MNKRFIVRDYRSEAKPIKEVYDTLLKTARFTLVNPKDWWRAKLLADRENLKAKHAAEMETFEKRWAEIEAKQGMWFA